MGQHIGGDFANVGELSYGSRHLASLRSGLQPTALCRARSVHNQSHSSMEIDGACLSLRGRTLPCSAHCPRATAIYSALRRLGTPCVQWRGTDEWKANQPRTGCGADHRSRMNGPLRPESRARLWPASTVSDAKGHGPCRPPRRAHAPVRLYHERAWPCRCRHLAQRYGEGGAGAVRKNTRTCDMLTNPKHLVFLLERPLAISEKFRFLNAQRAARVTASTNAYRDGALELCWPRR